MPPTQDRVGRVRIVPNLFGIPFGVVGLASAWAAAAPVLGSVFTVVSYALHGLAAAVWLVLIAAYLGQGPARLRSDLHDPTLSPFVALAPISMLLPAAALAAAAPVVGRVLLAVLLAVVLLLGGWLMGDWVVGGRRPDDIHPGYLLPTVAGGLVAAIASAHVGWLGIAHVWLGIGLVCTVVLGTVVLARLFVGAPLPTPLVPTLALEIAPPAVGGVAWFVVGNDHTGTASMTLAGSTIVMALVQLRCWSLYRRLRFGPSFWTFTFSYSSVATYSEFWLAADRPWGTPVWTWVALVLITLFIGTIGVNTVRGLVRGTFLPRTEGPAAVAAPGAAG